MIPSLFVKYRCLFFMHTLINKHEYHSVAQLDIHKNIVDDK